ncbi:MAG: PEP-CTERM system TPR-repeat protein PrsT [Kiloniellales bacterium]|nr:PEP-CTERM system TPR-repeat protein PrsT [Kiloniellales bacterium]
MRRVKFIGKALSGVLLALVVIVIALELLTSGSDEERYLTARENAREHMESGDLGAAVAELKVAIQRNPQSADARLRLAEVYLVQNAGAPAEKEAKAAASRGAAREQYLVPLGRAYLLQGEYGKVLAEIRSGDQGPAFESEVLLVRGDAYLASDRVDQALDAFVEAEALRPDDPRPLIGQARVLRVLDRLGRAELRADEALQLDPRSDQALIIKAELRLLSGDAAAALALFDQALAENAKSVQAVLGRGMALAVLGRDEEVLGAVTAVKELAPQHPMAGYLTALVFTKREDFRSARTALLSTGEFVQSYPPALLLIGAIQYVEDELEQARKNLARYLDLNPDHVPARIMHASALIRQGEANRAIPVLKLGLERAPQNPQILALLGTAHMNTRQFAEAESYFSRAATVMPENPELLNEIALGRLAQGNRDGAIAVLQSSFDLGSESIATGILLATTHITAGESQEALAVARKLASEQPDNPVPWNLMGVAQAAMEDFEEARSSFAKALEIDPFFSSAKMYLAGIHLILGETELAQKQYMEVLASTPDHIGAMMALSSLAMRSGDRAEAVSWLEKARAADGSSLLPLLALTDLYISAEESYKAAILARDLERRFPNVPAALDAAGRAQLANGNLSLAVRTLERLVAQSEGSAPALVRLAEAQILAGAEVEARETLDRALAVDPDYATTQRLLLSLDLRQGLLGDAAARAAAWGEKHPGTATSARLAGDVLMAEGRSAEAEAAYRTALELEPGPGHAIALFSAQRESGRHDEALETLRAWLAANPLDRKVQRLLAGTLLERGELAPAAVRYENLVEEQPNDLISLNNLAWIYQEIGDSRALEIAEKAATLVPDEAAVMDTIGRVLIENERVDRGLLLLERAVRALPDDPDIQYRYALALQLSGRAGEAREILEALLAAHASFKSKPEAEALLSALRDD